MIMRYLLVGEKYDRGPGGVLKAKFEAESDDAAKLKLCAMAFGMPQEVKHLTTANEVMSYLLNEVFDEDDIEGIYDVLDSDAEDPKAFAEYLLHEIFEPANGDGMDYYSSLENLDTEENIWEAEEY